MEEKRKTVKTQPVSVGDKKNQKHQENTGQRKNERDNMCPHSDPQKPKPGLRGSFSTE